MPDGSTTDRIAYSAPIGDEVKTTTCYMCACRCGIRVHLKDGRVRYIEGNPDHPVNKGVLCAKGSAGIMQVNAPSRLRAPLKRVGPRGSGAFEEISWDEALQLAQGRPQAGSAASSRAPQASSPLHLPQAFYPHSLLITTISSYWF